MIIQLPSEFDHTVGCYVTDYIQGVIFSLSAFISMCMPLQNPSRKQKMLRMSSAIGVLISSFYSALGAVVHQFYLDESSAYFYNVMWNVAGTFGFIGFIMIGLMMYSIYFTVNNIVLVGTGCLICVSMVFPWCTKMSVTVLTGITFIDSVIFVVSSCFVLKRAEKGVFDKLKKLFTVQIIALVIIIAGAACQVFKWGVNESFNYNGVYHVCNIIGLPVVLISVTYCKWYEINEEKEPLISSVV
ncbi:Hypothetical_protein [Hexamita inflata]|uniref:Hypothetical_protein n=1 Tax=Hexamita inflata TaxID=28002 RepID=A0AA86S3B5_9EUKA|nr:Hypothetical protein HINF_LOCUS64930 [Hexamita inflata]